MNNQLPEAQVTPPVMAQITPDIVSPQGKRQLFQTMARATVNKKALDGILSPVAQKVGANFTSRIKNPQTVVQKIAQKRVEGRDYNLDDVNDAYGARLIVQNKSDIPQAISQIKKAAGDDFKVLKSQEVKDGTYHAHHMDIQTADGTRGEVQVMLPQEALESLANHSLRAVWGEKPPDVVTQLRDKQAKLASNVSNSKAQALSDQLMEMSKANNAQPIDPRVIAQILQNGYNG